MRSGSDKVGENRNRPKRRIRKNRKVQATPTDRGNANGEAGKTKKRARKEMAILELLAGTFPAAFVLLETRRRPLKMGIAADAMAALPDVKRHLLNGALGRYTRARPYLTKLVEGAERIDLAGKVVGFVTAAEAAERLSPRATLARAA